MADKVTNAKYFAVATAAATVGSILISCLCPPVAVAGAVGAVVSAGATGFAVKSAVTKSQHVSKIEQD